MPPTTPTDPAMCSLCPRSKKAHHPKKLVRFDSIVDTFSISDSNVATNERSHDSWQGHDSDQDREESCRDHRDQAEYMNLYKKQKKTGHRPQHTR